MPQDPKNSLSDELTADIGSDYSAHLRAAAGMLAGGDAQAQAAVPYLLFSIARSLEDLSFLVSNDSISVLIDDEAE